MNPTWAKEQNLAQALAILVPLGLLIGAYSLEYTADLYPCEYCMWQRYALFSGLGVASISLISKHKRLWIALGAYSILVSGLVGGYQAGIELGWWQGTSECVSVAGGASALESVMNAPLVRCDQAPWHFLGISLAGWNFLISTGTAIAIGLLMYRKGFKPGERP